MLHFHFEPACGSGKKIYNVYGANTSLTSKFYSPPKKKYLFCEFGYASTESQEQFIDELNITTLHHARLQPGVEGMTRNP